MGRETTIDVLRELEERDSCNIIGSMKNIICTTKAWLQKSMDTGKPIPERKLELIIRNMNALNDTIVEVEKKVFRKGPSEVGLRNPRT